MGLVVKDVSKVYGDKTVVDKISFSIDKPGVFGLLGTNGAGKSTTIRMMLGILKKNGGEISWNGLPVERKNVNFGYLPEERGIYPKTKIYEQLLYFAELRKMKKEDAMKEIDYWMGRLKIEEYKNMTAEKLSKGNQQKVQFLTALLNDPELIVLDEPFSGLDPVNAEILRDVILELVEKGKYIVMSSHQMTSIEEFCSDVVILNKGKTVLKGNLQEIKDSYPANRVEIITKSDISDIVKSSKLKVLSKVDNKYELAIKDEKDAKNILDELFKKKIEIVKYEVKKPSLNEIFIEKVGE